MSTGDERQWIVGGMAVFDIRWLWWWRWWWHRLIELEMLAICWLVGMVVYTERLFGLVESIVEPDGSRFFGCRLQVAGGEERRARESE